MKDYPERMTRTGKGERDFWGNKEGNEAIKEIQEVRGVEWETRGSAAKETKVRKKTVIFYPQAHLWYAANHVPYLKPTSKRYTHTTKSEKVACDPLLTPVPDLTLTIV